MVRPALTGLATAYFRLFVLDTLAAAPARPATLLARVSAESLPIASGGFGRALRSLIEGGHVAPAGDGTVALTGLGAAERVAERQRWSAVLASASRLLDVDVPGPAPSHAAPERVTAPRAVPVADAYLDRVLVATVRERIAAARDGAPGFAVALGELEVTHPAEATRRAIVHRVIRATLGGATTLFGGDVAAYRYGDEGVALVVGTGMRVDRGDLVADSLRRQLRELLRSVTASVRAFSGSRWRVRAGSATWSVGVPTTLALLRLARESLAADEERSVA